MSDAIKPVLAREMEVYAGFLAYADHHIGRLIDAIEELGVLDDTLIYVIIGDNGASAEGNFIGTTNEGFTINHMNELEDRGLHGRAHGRPRARRDSYNHYAIGWAHAMDTPYQWTKQVASHWGGTRNGTIVRWPSGIQAKGEIRNQFAHVHRRRPDDPRGGRDPRAAHRQRRHAAPDGGRRACATASTTPTPPSGTTTQYFEMVGNRAIYHQGWTAVRQAQGPLGRLDPRPRRGRVGALRHRGGLDASPTTCADEHPEKLAELQRLFLIQAARFNVLPLDIRSGERFNPDIAGRPRCSRGTTQTLYGGMKRLSENAVVDPRTSRTPITAEIDGARRRRRRRDHGAGRRHGGWSLFTKDGMLKYCYNVLGIESTHIVAETPLSRPGRRRCGPTSPTTAAGWARAAPSRCSWRCTKIGEGRVERTIPFMFSMDETLDVGLTPPRPCPPNTAPRTTPSPARSSG